MKRNYPGGLWIFALAIFFAFAGKLALTAQPQPTAGGTSRTMEQGIRLYNEGQDNEAMDRFMEILTRGTPSEKSLANEYITKITLRINTGVATLKDKGTNAGALSDVEEVKQAPVKRAASRRERAGDWEDEEVAEADAKALRKEKISEKIAEKIAGMRRAVLLGFSRNDAISVYMGDGLPKAITLDTAELFSEEMILKPEAMPLVSALAGLMFTLGKADCLILPEGSAQNDVKIKNIRQALALYSALISRGLSPARVDVNLTGADIRFPKELTSISGLIILFSYDSVRRLKDVEDFATKGPKISLGVYPTAFSTRNNEGAIVEFSVFEPPTGTPSWKFQIFEVQKDNSILLLQEISGTGAQYNQSFWNGRKNFFGAAYPSGKYMFSLTAADVQGRETTVRRLLVIRPTPEEEKALRAKAAAEAVKEREPVSGVRARMAPQQGVSAAGRGKRKSPLKATYKPAKAGGKLAGASGAEKGAGSSAGGLRGTPQGGAADQAEGENLPFSGQVSYKIYFKENSATITANSEKKLSQVAETLNYYPMATVKLTGYAYSGESNAEAMAENRVNYVVARLSGKYKIDKDRLDSQSKVSDTPKTLVEIQLAGKE